MHDSTRQNLDLSLGMNECASAECNTVQQKIQANKKKNTKAQTHLRDSFSLRKLSQQGSRWPAARKAWAGGQPVLRRSGWQAAGWSLSGDGGEEGIRTNKARLQNCAKFGRQHLGNQPAVVHQASQHSATAGAARERCVVVCLAFQCGSNSLP
jgi:hypothetical protein